MLVNLNRHLMIDVFAAHLLQILLNYFKKFGLFQSWIEHLTVKPKTVTINSRQIYQLRG